MTQTTYGSRTRTAGPEPAPRPGHRRTIRGRLQDPQGPDPTIVPGRFHLYADRAGALAHRSVLVIALAGLNDVITVDYVDDPATRTGGIPLLREGYRATDPGFHGAADVPALWDRQTRQVVSNDHLSLEKDLATEFSAWSTTGADLYPADLRGEIDELERWLRPVVEQGPSSLHGWGGRAGDEARARLAETFDRLDRVLSRERYLLGDSLTLADIRLWATLVRFGKDAGEGFRISVELAPFVSLWAYAQNLYERHDVRATTTPRAYKRPQLKDIQERR